MKKTIIERKAQTKIYRLVCGLILDTSGQYQTRYSKAHEFIDKGQIVLLA